VNIFPDGRYDHGATFRNANDRVEWERTFRTGTDAQRLMAAAMITANPGTPEAEIREKLSVPPLPAAGPVSVTQMTITDVLGIGAAADAGHMYDRSPTDFSGTPGGYSASSVPGLSAG
jgi:hypothetical protein